MQQLSKGILIMALGHPNYYQMAVNLAASIRVNDPDLQICLVTDNVVKAEHEFLFNIVKAPSVRSIIQKGQKQYIKAKLFMYELSPFYSTIFLDADQILIPGKKLSPVFDELKDIDFTMSNHGLATESNWADIKEVQKLYGEKSQYWSFHSEFVFFEKTAEVKKYFAAAIKVYEDNKIKSATKFAEANMADELALQAASMITGLYPHQENWTPNFWHSSNPSLSRKYPYQLTDFITYSIGGNQMPPHIRDNYNNLVNHYFYTLKLKAPAGVKSKIIYLPERKSDLPETKNP
jgi:hypothetical protein